MTRPTRFTPLLLAFLATAALATEPLAIQDNSFLLEEAYNQEKNVVQHIFAFQHDPSGAWVGTFTQEWPAGGQRHQLSYTLPLQRVDGGARGIGDALLNYRLQLAGDAASRLAIAPRISLILPTGSERRGLGSGGYGFDCNFPVSVVVSNRLVTHWNAGISKVPSSREPKTLSAGGSAIWAARPNIHLMLENRWSRDSESTFVVSPGIRWAWNLAHDLQIVPGVAVPINTRTHDRSIFLYLSFEHPFR